MAKVTVEGTVTRINRNGVGFGIREQWQKRDGTTHERYWAVWMPDGTPTRVIVGDEVTVTGRLTSKVSPRDARYVDVAVQEAAVTVTKENGPRSWENNETPLAPAAFDHAPRTNAPVWPLTPIPSDDDAPEPDPGPQW